MSKKKNIGLIFGGVSPEHSISCLTAAGVFSVIDRNKYNVIGIGITKSGMWTLVDEKTLNQYQISDGDLPEVISKDQDLLWSRTKDGCVVAVREDKELVDSYPIDVAFTLLHGPFGEDGTIQGMLEMFGVPYVGSGVAASANCMDKHITKMMLEAAGISVGPWISFDTRMWKYYREEVLSQIKELAYPLFVKPCRGGSSIGITRVASEHELIPAILKAQKYDPKIMVEQGFVGVREIECAVLGNPDIPDGCETSIVGEIKVKGNNGFFDFDTKYIYDVEGVLIAKADVSEKVSDEVRRIAKLAFNTVEAEGLARVDVFVDEFDKVWVSEINTMPGFTQMSMFPMIWQATGVDYPTLVSRLIELALNRSTGLR